MATASPYPPEQLDPDDDDGTIVDNVKAFESEIIGHRIVKVETTEVPPKYEWSTPETGLLITLDNGKRVGLVDTEDCCAYTEVKEFLFHHDRIDHIITGVGTTDGYTTWHVFADFGDVMEIKVGWSCGNPFWYGYGFDLRVTEVER